MPLRKQLTLSVKPDLFKLILCFILLSASNLIQAKEVTQQFNGLTLNANLEIAEGKGFDDGMVLILHGMMAHNKMELVAASQEILLDNERNSLAINLSLSRDNRHGFFDCTWSHRHKQEDAVEELGNWVKWLRQQGVSDITLMAHSRAANQSMVYAAENLDPEVTRLVMLAPGADDVKEPYEDRYGSVFDNNVNLMQQNIASGTGAELVKDIDFWFCPKASITAESFISYYGHESKFRQFHQYLPRIPIPTLVITGTQDERQPRIKKHVGPFVDDKRLFLVEIENAGHFFRDLNIEEAMEAMIEFMEITQ